MRRVVLLLHRPPDHPRTAQALRVAVGYLTVGLQVTVVLCGPAQALLGTTDAAPRRALDTLRHLGQAVVLATDCDLAALCQGAHAVVSW